mgnify:CR=1 FL=1
MKKLYEEASVQDIADAIAFAEEMAKQQAVNPMP